MEAITLYFEKFKTLAPPERFLRAAVVAAVEEFFGEALMDECVRVQGNTVFITAHPVLKTEVFIRKKELIEHINKTLLKRRVQEVR